MQNGLPVEEYEDAPVQVAIIEPDDVPIGDTKKNIDGFVTMLFVDGNTDDENQHKNNVNKHLNESCGSYIHNSEPVHNVDEKAAEEKDLTNQVEEFKAKSDVSKESVAETDEIDDASKEETESTLESSVMDVEVKMQGEEPDPEELENSGAGVQSEEFVPEELESLGAEVQSEEFVPKERATGEDTMLVAYPQAPLVHQQVSVESGESYE
ncbi:hypothetical protein RJT34_20647 [Clitoria ternatea]|uniref:Uncharacterized protein n=1 Tax=Clitoria ternatea TaxID=43366 RepID=A0AAN9IU98_CLITE